MAPTFGQWHTGRVGFDTRQLKIVCCFILQSSVTPTCQCWLFSLVSFLSSFSFPVQLASFSHKTSSAFGHKYKVCKWFISVSVYYSPLSSFWDSVLSGKPSEMEINVAPILVLQHPLFQVVVIFDGHVPLTNLSEMLKYLVKNRTYLEWKSGDPKEQETFWSRLRETILAVSARCPPITSERNSP